MFTAILSILGAALGLWLFYLKRKKTPTLEERQDDLDLELNEIIKELHKLRQRGDMAGAESLLRRLSSRASGYKLHIHKAGTVYPSNPIREQLGDSDSKGNHDSSGEPKGT